MISRAFGKDGNDAHSARAVCSGVSTRAKSTNVTDRVAMAWLSSAVCRRDCATYTPWTGDGATAAAAAVAAAAVAQGTADVAAGSQPPLAATAVASASRHASTIACSLVCGRTGGGEVAHRVWCVGSVDARAGGQGCQGSEKGGAQPCGV
eukprot:358340-Chlamydomonas_euryale.AAC.1